MANRLTRVQMGVLDSLISARRAEIEDGSLTVPLFARQCATSIGRPVSESNVRASCKRVGVRTPMSRRVTEGRERRNGAPSPNGSATGQSPLALVRRINELELRQRGMGLVIEKFVADLHPGMLAELGLKEDFSPA